MRLFEAPGVTGNLQTEPSRWRFNLLVILYCYLQKYIYIDCCCTRVARFCVYFTQST